MIINSRYMFRFTGGHQETPWKKHTDIIIMTCTAMPHHANATSLCEKGYYSYCLSTHCSSDMWNPQWGQSEFGQREQTGTLTGTPSNGSPHSLISSHGWTEWSNSCWKHMTLLQIKRCSGLLLIRGKPAEGHQKGQAQPQARDQGALQEQLWPPTHVARHPGHYRLQTEKHVHSLRRCLLTWWA